MLWFDKIGALHSDNSCSGCHWPSNGFGATQSMAIGIQNDNLVGPHRQGPHNGTGASTHFPANDPVRIYLLMAQGEMPPTELVEVAGFTGTR